MTGCPDATEWVLYASGEVAAGRRHELDEHLQTCPACQAELNSLRRGFEALDTLAPVPPLRADVLHALRNRLAAEVRATHACPSRRRHPVRWLAGAAAVAAAVLVAVLINLPESPEPTWTDVAQMDEEIVEITAGLELLETDTFATVLDFTPEEKEPSQNIPAGQGRANPVPAATQHG